MNDGAKLASIVLEMTNQDAVQKGDGDYYPRSSAVSRCVRDMTMHRYGEPWSDMPDSSWGTQFRFDVGHDTEERMIQAMEAAGISVVCQQMRVKATTPSGIDVIGHMDGIAIIPEEYPLGGKWYVLDIKSAGKYMYGKVYDENVSKPKSEHIKQIAVYSQSKVIDHNFPAVNGVKVQDLHFDGYEFGGGLVGYLSIERPTKGYGDKKVDLPKIHFCDFEIDPSEVEVWLENTYDLVEQHYQDKTMPPIPSQRDEMVWGGIRCSPRWCRRYSVCKGEVPPMNKELREVLNG
tara:strand:+ start:990 stop:1859 length:870 start_codon:yes stop_codon:yes gene_type:complete